jgi:RNA polymerase sigma factor (sigma-70 family)
METARELIPHLFRTEYSKITVVLAKLFGFENITIAEDIASDAFLLAAEHWDKKGIPENPVAWLYTVAKNKAKDQLKHHAVFNQKVSPRLQEEDAGFYEQQIDLSGKNIVDSQLQMMFAICNPAIPPEAQIGLSLRILCGFGIDEIAGAFLTNKENINKRLYRAKEKLRQEKVKIELPPPSEINNRLETVLTTLYLLFNEGYYSQSQNTALRKDLCLEAMRLTFMLVENEATNKPVVNALLSLMCFHASRFEARFNRHGETVLYEEQDETLWNRELIVQGEFYLNKAAVGDELSKYHLEAGIAYWHTHKADTNKKWESILQLYNRLLLIEYSPVAALNRTYALAKARSKEDAIVEAQQLQLQSNHLYHTLLGYLYTDIDNEKAFTNLETALKLAKSPADKEMIKKSIGKIGG